MATEPKDAPSAQIEAALAPPVGLTVFRSEEAGAESLKAGGAPGVEPDLAETDGAPTAETQEGGRAAAEDDGAAKAAAAPVRNKASAFERDFAAARDRMVAINVKVLQAILANAETNLNFLSALSSVKSLSELIALQSEFACKQVDAMARPAAEIGAMTQTTMASAVDAMRSRITRSLAS